MRRQTRWYIRDAPFEICLTPYAEIKTPAGGKKWTPGIPREPQIVRLAPLDRQRATTRSSSASGGVGGLGSQTEVAFEVIGDVDLEIEKHDRFPGPDGTEYEVTEVAPTGSAPYLRRAFVRGSPARGS